MFSIRKYRDEEKEKELVYFDHQKIKLSLFAPSLRQQLVLDSFACCLVSITRCSSYRSTVLNQSACVFAWDDFLKWILMHPDLMQHFSADYLPASHALIDHFRVTKGLSFKARPGAQPFLEHEFNLHVNEISFS